MNQSKRMIAGSILMAGILTFSFYGLGRSWASSKHQVDPLYLEECGSCHMAYPAQLLPPKSWQKIMAQLENHFGESAELDPITQQDISSYLNQVSKRNNGSYRKLLRNLGNKTPMRMTELPYFIHEHDEIPSRYIKANDKVGSLSQCNACHQRAEQGDFDEDDVFIPGFGRWDD
ncbi:MAG: hypothetical protein GY806_02500 [Gammaproteobacteria bacterium]|nr:hypothetical protein [Gammaproteobacteria bacterium]